MSRGMETATATTPASPPPPARAEGAAPALDLDRLVWDPEYREAMRPLLKRGG